MDKINVEFKITIKISQVSVEHYQGKYKISQNKFSEWV